MRALTSRRPSDVALVAFVEVVMSGSDRTDIARGLKYHLRKAQFAPIQTACRLQP